MTKKERTKWIEFSLVSGLSQVLLMELYRFNKNPFEIEIQGDDFFRKITGRKIDFNEKVKTLDEEISVMKKEKIRTVFIEEEEYPKLLREIKHPPLFLRVKGKIPKDSERMIAIVGTRRCTPYGRRITQHFCEELARRNFHIVSGFARGIDTIAHKTAIENRGKTIAVFGSGIDVVYPPENKNIVEEVAENGAIVSEYPCGTQPLKRNFPERNRIISGISFGVCVMEAPRRSGALITADFALEQGREVWACCGEIFEKTFQGCFNLIKEGAKLLISIEDIMEETELPMEFAEKKEIKRDENLNLTGKQKIVYDLIGFKPILFDEIKAKTNFSTPEIFKLLTELQIYGFIETYPGGKFVRKK